MIDSPIFFSLVLSWYNSLLYETPKGQQSIKNNSGTLHWYDHTILPSSDCHFSINPILVKYLRPK